jgi:hypothetical protein
MKKNILLILSIILLIILLPSIFEKNKNFSIEKIKTLEKKALFEHNKTAAEELVFINAKNNNRKKAKFWVDIVRKIENKK